MFDEILRNFKQCLRVTPKSLRISNFLEIFATIIGELSSEKNILVEKVRKQLEVEQNMFYERLTWSEKKTERPAEYHRLVMTDLQLHDDPVQELELARVRDLSGTSGLEQPCGCEHPSAF